MRTLMKVTVNNAEGNKAISEGTMPQIIGAVMEKLHPEAAYFYPENGIRTCIMIFDMKDSSDLPPITEPLFQQLNAKIEFTPVMNLEDLQKGLGQIGTGK